MRSNRVEVGEASALRKQIEDRPVCVVFTWKILRRPSGAYLRLGALE